MIPFFASLFQRVLSGEIADVVESKSASKFIYRDELSKKKKSSSKQKSYYGDSFSTSKPFLEDEMDIKSSSDATSCFDGKASTRIRVKVRMTKQEAARLLSKCKDGGVLEFRDVARELVDLPMDRLSIVSASCPGNNLLLDSIPEE